jgi:hypothetical protein
MIWFLKLIPSSQYHKGSKKGENQNGSFKPSIKISNLNVKGFRWNSLKNSTQFYNFLILWFTFSSWNTMKFFFLFSDLCIYLKFMGKNLDIISGFFFIWKTKIRFIKSLKVMIVKLRLKNIVLMEMYFLYHCSPFQSQVFLCGSTLPNETRNTRCKRLYYKN